MSQSQEQIPKDFLNKNASRPVEVLASDNCLVRYFVWPKLP